MQNLQNHTPRTIGIIANPASAKDIRRIIANAGNLQIADRVNIVLRVLASAGSCGVQRALVMPDKSGIRAMLARNLERERKLGHPMPEVEFLEMPVTSTVDDTLRAAALMRDAGVAAIVVLGGDGTHRAVVRRCGDVPIAGLSTGTNNAFPEMREPTLTGIAVGLWASGRIPQEVALAPNKLLEIGIDGEPRDLALVDAVIAEEHTIGARALWRTETLRAVYATFADPEAIGMSAIPGLLDPVGRADREGRAVEMAHGATPARLHLHAPIAPGIVRPVPIAGWSSMRPDVPHAVSLRGGIVALDGERELEYTADQKVTVTLRAAAFRTVDVSRCLRTAAAAGLLRADADGPLPGAAMH